jgi:putative DNA primase/helicase
VTSVTISQALGYAARGWPVFPCVPDGPRRKQPLTPHGFLDASREEAQIREWWWRYPNALIGVPTGRPIGADVLDVDVKYHDRNGFDTLAALGQAVLPDTPMAHTASGGLHLYFRLPDHVEIGCTEGEKGRGIGRGLDWRGVGGFVIVPSPGSGYSWDPHWNFDTVALAPVPVGLSPREPERPAAAARPVRPTAGLSPYAEAALDSAARRIIAAPAGEQEVTINGECFAIGTLAGAGAIPADFALDVLLFAARQARDYDPRHPWRAHELQRKVDRAFNAGVRHSRERRRA